MLALSVSLPLSLPPSLYHSPSPSLSVYIRYMHVSTLMTLGTCYPNEAERAAREEAPASARGIPSPNIAIVPDESNIFQDGNFG